MLHFNKVFRIGGVGVDGQVPRNSNSAVFENVSFVSDSPASIRLHYKRPFETTLSIVVMFLLSVLLLSCKEFIEGVYN